MDYFEENRLFFKEHDPSFLKELESWELDGCYTVNQTRRGELIVEVDGVHVHSRIAPSKEAARFLEKQRVMDVNIHFGFGFGYYFDAQKKKMSSKEQKSWEILIFEPDTKLLITALRHLSFSTLFQGTRARIFGDQKRFLQTLELEYMHFPSFEMLVLPYHLSVFPDTARECHERSISLARQKYFFRKSERALASVFSTSTLRSLKYVFNTYTFDPLYLAFKGKPAVILAPGPSLEKNICDLIPYRENVLLFAVSRAVGTMEKYGIQPDFMVHIEAQDFFRLIEGKTNLTDSIFLLPEQVEKKFFQFPSRQTIAYHSVSNVFSNCLIDRFPELKRIGIPSGGSVAQDAFSLAVFMGCHPVVLIGQDLALSGSHMYADPNEGVGDKLKMMKVKGYFGPEVTTIGNYEKFLVWFQESVEPLKEHFKRLKLINATEGGAYINGFEHMSFDHVAFKFFQKPVNRDQVLDRVLKHAPKRFIKSTDLRLFLSKCRTEFEQVQRKCETIQNAELTIEDIQNLAEMSFTKNVFRAFAGFDLDEEMKTVASQNDKIRDLFDTIKKTSTLIVTLFQEAIEEFK